MKRTILFLFVSFLLVSCGTTTQRIAVDPILAAQEAEKQRQLFIESQIRDRNRIQSLAAPLLTANTALCAQNTKPHVGVFYANQYSWSGDYRTSAVNVLGVGERPMIIHVTPDSPAALAGMEFGDKLLAVNREDVPTGKRAVKGTVKLLTKTLVSGEPVTFSVLRDGEAKDLAVTPVDACSFTIVLSLGDEVNAYADGNAIYITKGMLRFVENDAELTAVLAHELAHNAMGHLDKKAGNYLLGGIFDIVAAAYGVNTQGAFGNTTAQMFSQDFEAEADYVGLYLMARAGYSIEDVPMLWRRMGSDNPGAIKTRYGTSHPGTAERYLALDVAVKEIDEKKGRSEALLPELKKQD